jgi:hypothetical protein
LVEPCITDAAFLHLRGPSGPHFDIGANLGDPEPGAPGFEAEATVELAERGIAHRFGLLVELNHVGKNQAAGDQGINDCARRLWHPSM